jgi:ATP-binding cassette subfamily B protein
MQTFPTTLPALFREYLGRQTLGFTILMLFPAAIVLESTVMPYALRLIVDHLQTAPADASVWRTLTPAIALYVGSQAVMFFLFRIQDWVSTRVKPRLLAEMRLDAFTHAQRHSHRFFTDHFAGSLANKVADIPRAFSTLLDNINWRFTPALSVTLSVLITVAILHWQAAALLLVWTAMHLGIALWFARPINEQSRENAERKSELQGLIVDSFTNQLAARLFARFTQERAVLGEAQERERQSFRRMMLTMFKLRFFLDLPMLLAVVMLLCLCILLWERQALSVGDIVFILYASMNVMTWVWMFATELPQFYADTGVIRQALETLRAPMEITDAPDATPLQLKGGSIVFDHVTFGYRETGGVFDGLTVTIAPGERVGLVGFSGSGKTTFLNLLLRLYDVQGGRILIDGQDIARVTQDSLHEAIAVIPQDTSLFHRSLRDNIRYGRPEATEEEVIAAATQAQCHDFIMGLEKGYDTEVGERGVKLSGGQRQRIALARAILKNAPILVMDEATSALDSVTERVIQESMQTLMQGRTAIVIAHRLSTLAHLDRILVFDKGRLIEQGTHEALLALGGHYATLWQMQAGGFLPETR